MVYKLRRAAKIYREQGLSVIAKKALRYLPIELNNVFYRLRQDSPTKIMEEDWDTLIILDACRYDLFEQTIDTMDWDPGPLESRISLGSTSEEFLEKNFLSGEFQDTVYVNTNPYLPRTGLDEGTFHAVINLLDDWDDETHTVLPSTVVESSIKAHENFPNKRLIIHFMQPHYPFIGDNRFGERGWLPDSAENVDGKTVWDLLREDPDQDAIESVWGAYQRNLELALDAVEELLEALDGTSVITSDHGNLIGERLSPVPTKRMFGHPLGVYHPSLVKVPWYVIPGDARREVTSDPPIRTNSASEEVTESRLEALGYK